LLIIQKGWLLRQSDSAIDTNSVGKRATGKRSTQLQDWKTREKESQMVYFTCSIYVCCSFIVVY